MAYRRRWATSTAWARMGVGAVQVTVCTQETPPSAELPAQLVPWAGCSPANWASAPSGPRRRGTMQRELPAGDPVGVARCLGWSMAVSGSPLGAHHPAARAWSCWTARLHDALARSAPPPGTMQGLRPTPGVQDRVALRPAHLVKYRRPGEDDPVLCDRRPLPLGTPRRWRSQTRFLADRAPHCGPAGHPRSRNQPHPNRGMSAAGLGETVPTTV